MHNHVTKGSHELLGECFWETVNKDECLESGAGFGIPVTEA